MSKTSKRNNLYNITGKALREQGVERFGRVALGLVPPLNAVESWARKTPARRVRFTVGAWAFDFPASEAANLLPLLVTAFAEQIAESQTQ